VTETVIFDWCNVSSTKLSDPVRALEKHTPELEELEWSRHKYIGETSRFDTFSDLQHLRTVRLEYGLLVAYNDDYLDIFQGLQAIFPGSLENLILENIPIASIERKLCKSNAKREQASLVAPSDSKHAL
jgi:hypothetical protein